jgi:plasmid stabilization system protein ParE
VKIEWSGPALAFLRAQAARIRRDRPLAAQRWLAAVQGSVERLRRFPLSGRTIPELPVLEAREVVDGGYRIFYRAEPGRVYVIGVQHSRQEFDLTLAGDTVSPRTRAMADRAIRDFLVFCEPEVRELALRTCDLLHRVLPDAVARVHPEWRMIVFGSGSRTAEMIFGVAPLRDRVSIQLTAVDLPDPAGLLAREGAALPHVKISSAAVLEDPRLEALLRAAVEVHDALREESEAEASVEA